MTRLRMLLCLFLGAGLIFAGTVYSVDMRSDQFISFSPADPGTVTVIGPQGLSLYGIDFNSAGTVLCATDNDARQLGTINTATGAFTSLVALTGLAAGDTITGISINPLTEVMYLMAATSDSTLFTLDIATGALTQIGTATGRIIIDLAFSPGGALYGIDILDDNLYGIDPTTGATTLIGPTGYALNYAQGMDFDYATGILYAALYQGSGTNTFAWINTSTGAATAVGQMNDREMEIAIDSPYGAGVIPEPSTFALVLLPLAVGALLRKRL